jgi:hypothetical protein
MEECYFFPQKNIYNILGLKKQKQQFVKGLSISTKKKVQFSNFFSQSIFFPFFHPVAKITKTEKLPNINSKQKL